MTSELSLPKAQLSIHHFMEKIWSITKAHALFICLGALYLIFGGLYLRLFGDDSVPSLSYWSYFGILKYIVPIGIILFGLEVVRIALMERPSRLLATCFLRAKTKYLTLDRLIPATIALLVLPLVFSVFTSIKLQIPLVNPFSWDPLFASWDAAVHFGRQPWEWLQPMLGTSSITHGIYFLYIFGWGLALNLVVFWQAFSVSKPQVRMRYLVAFVLLWGLFGSVFSTWLSSAGPAFYDRVVGTTSEFTQLNDYLAAVFGSTAPSIIQIQENLWQGYIAAEGRRFGGISAMPSMHIACVTINAIVAWHYSRVLGLLLTVFACLIFLGSVHLAWHYAIDGYAGAIGAVACWYLAGFLIKRCGGQQVESA